MAEHSLISVFHSPQHVSPPFQLWVFFFSPLVNFSNSSETIRTTDERPAWCKMSYLQLICMFY